MSDHRDIRGLRLSELARGRAHAFELRPEAAALAALRDRLGLLALRKVRLTGEVAPESSRDWTLQARLGATVEQPCVVTLAPVTTRIDTDVTRRYLADWQEPTGLEVEMEEDESIEPLPATIDLAAILEEELALALPLYPRAEGVEFEEPAPESDEDERPRPFAGLAALKARLEEDGDDGDGQGGES